MKVATPGLLLLALLAPAAWAQDKDKEKDKEKLTITESSPYFPLTEGTTWTYKVTGGKEGKPVVIKVAGFEKVKVKDGDKVNEEVCARLETRRDDVLVATELFTVRKDGVFRVAFGGTQFSSPVCLIKIPVTKGEEWEFNTKIGEGKDAPEVKGRFAAGEQKGLKIGEKTYDTITVTSKTLKVDNQDLTTTYYFAEKVGMVKQEVEIGGKKVTLEYDEPKK
jgi:hypothetical protein